TWVKIDIENHPDKIKLKQIHSKNYPQLKAKLIDLQKDWKDQALADSLKKLINDIDSTFKLQNEIMSKLSTFDSYQDGITPMLMEGISDEATAKINTISAHLHDILDQLKLTTSEQQISMIENMQLLNRTNVILVGVIIILGFLLTIRLSSQIIKPVNSLHNLVNRVSQGELNNTSIKITNDEIGEMMTDVQKMIEGLKTTATFANEIGKGNLESEFAPLSENDVL